MPKLKIQKTGNVDIGFPFSQDVAAGNIGVVGGADGLGIVSNYNTLYCVANIEYSPGSYAAGEAYIVAQKGKRRFLVANIGTPSQQAICVLSNLANGNASVLSSGEMALLAENSAGIIAIASINNKYMTSFPPDYANTNSYGNFANATRYLVSFDSANATVQPGGTSNIGFADSYT